MFTTHHTRHTPPHSPAPATAKTLSRHPIGRPHKDAPPPPRVLLTSHLPPVRRPRPERTDAAGDQQKRRRRRRREREGEGEGEGEAPAAKKRRRKRRTRAEMLAARAPPLPALPTPYMALPPCKHAAIARDAGSYAARSCGPTCSS